MQGNKQQNFVAKRQQHSINLRKINRQEMLMKRRFISNQQMLQNNNQQINNNIKPIVIDESFRTYIVPLLKQKYELQNQHQLIALLFSENIVDKHKGVIGLRKLSNTQNTEQIAKILLQNKNISQLIDLYNQDDYLQIKFQILWTFTNLTSTSVQFSIQLSHRKVIPIISTDIVHKNDAIKFHAIWLTGNIAADNYKFRDQFIENGCVHKIIKFLQAKRSNSEIETAIWTITNLARGSPPPRYEQVKYVIATVSQALKSGLIKQQSIISDCLWTLANLSDGGKIRLYRLAQANVIPKVMQYLRSSNMALKVPAIRIVGNMTNGSPQRTNEILKQHYLDIALQLLDTDKAFLLKEICWTISNIAAGTDEQILQVLRNQDLIKKLLLIYPTQIPEVKMQIIWIFTNFQHSQLADKILQIYKNIDIIYMIGEQLKQNIQRCVYEALTCLYKIFVMTDKVACDCNQQNQLVAEFIQKGYGTILQDCQKNSSQRIYKQSNKIIQRFFKNSQTIMEDF